MRRMNKYISIVTIILMVIGFSREGLSQDNKVRASLKASVSQRIGVDTDILIDYSRPGVKGRIVWGELVPFGMNEGNKYSKGKPFPWRVGANENTTIEFSKDVLIEGIKVVAGKYSIHMIPSETEWIVIFNKKNSEWGSYSYDENEDVMRIKVKPVSAPHQEWMLFGFENLEGTSATCFLHWEKLKLQFNITVSE